MKKVTKITTIIMAVIMILSSTTTALAASYNTAQTAESVGIGTTYTTFKYGYPDGNYRNALNYTEKFFSFVPSVTGYYEFVATGYENTQYIEGKTPYVEITIRDARGNYVRSTYTNAYTLETKVAEELTAGQVYYINVSDTLFNTVSYKSSSYGYVEQTIALKVAPHSHTFTSIQYSAYTVNSCSYCNYSEKVENVAAIKSVKLSQTTFTYNGSVQTPTVIAYNTSGQRISSYAYTTTISGNKKSIGKYTVTVKFGYAYDGKTYKFTYTIAPKGTSISKLSAKKKGFTVKWKKQKSNTQGYAVRYSTNSKMKNAKTVYVSGNGKTSKSISNLKKGKKYYVQVATYKSVKGGKAVSKYSSAKSVKTK